VEASRRLALAVLAAAVAALVVGIGLFVSLGPPARGEREPAAPNVSPAPTATARTAPKETPAAEPSPAATPRPPAPSPRAASDGPPTAGAGSEAEPRPGAD